MNLNFGDELPDTLEELEKILDNPPSPEEDGKHQAILYLTIPVPDHRLPTKVIATALRVLASAGVQNVVASDGYARLDGEVHRVLNLEVATPIRGEVLVNLVHEFNAEVVYARNSQCSQPTLHKFINTDPDDPDKGLIEIKPL